MTASPTSPTRGHEPSESPDGDAMARSATTRPRGPSPLRRARTFNARAMAAEIPKRLRRHPPPSPALDLDWVELVEDVGNDTGEEVTYSELKRMNRRRKDLLKLARGTSDALHNISHVGAPLFTLHSRIRTYMDHGVRASLARSYAVVPVEMAMVGTGRYTDFVFLFRGVYGAVL